MTDLELLQRYEPILKFTYGELFFPCAVDEYIQRCSLWTRPKNGPPEQLVSKGSLSLATLAEFDQIKPEHTLFLQYVDAPLDGLAYQRWRRRKDRPRFRAPGRLARVGIGTRITDALLGLSLILRGKVPGGTVAAAEVQYRETQEASTRPYVYYGRVIRDGGYIILHYLFFYAMNNWRSTFYGVNDHEADWEQVLVYLEDHPEAAPTPVWVAAAVHDFSGDDLRRRWDDPDLTRVGTHPVIFIGAGSHASYFEQGEYLASLEVRFLRDLGRLLRAMRRFWTETLRQGEPDEDRPIGFLTFPFIDYARGDGLTIGPGQENSWTRILISDEDPWVENYRGLWGLDTRDPLRGESAPSGPKYNRDGTVRQTWHNPLGWSGLHKVAPPHLAIPKLETKITELETERAALLAEIRHERTEITKMEIKSRALRLSEHLDQTLAHQEKDLASRAQIVNQKHNNLAELEDTLKACRVYLDELASGKRGDPQAHIRHKHKPQSETEVLRSRLIETWAAMSTGALLIGIGVTALTNPIGLLPSLGVMIGSFILLESLFQRQLHLLLLNITIGLAIVTSAVILVAFFWEILAITVSGVALMIIASNLRELRDH
ncbi:MAG: hypothetical protein GYB66_11715 [Chloroflexi bacterium]|nr:hypothetical protein [Chloroflexota bacterium]